jgi:hypothetical protein
MLKVSSPPQDTYAYLLFFVLLFLNRVGVDLDESLKEEPSSQQASSIKSWIKHGLVHCSSVLLEYIAKGAISKMGCLC